MKSDEAIIGIRVRVSGDYRSEHLRGQVGTISKRWGDPHYAALDVLLDNGTSQLFWHYQLEAHDGDGYGLG